MAEEYEDFLNKLQKRGSKPHKIGHCLGSRDAFNWVRRNRWKALKGRTCDKLLYSKIVSEVNRILAEKLLEGHTIELPSRFGRITLISNPAKVSMKDGVLQTNYRTDWKKTCEYMFEDNEAMEQHKRVMRIQPFVYLIKYRKAGARFSNRYFYRFRPNRSLVRALGKAIKEKRVNAEIIDTNN